MRRVIFDRSAFHGDDFQRLKGSRLETLCRHGLIRVFHTPIFLEETLDMYGTKQHEMWCQLPFVLGICNGGIFRPIRKIWHDELVRNRGLGARILWNAKERRRFENALQRGYTSDGHWIDWVATASERDDKHGKKANQKQTYGEVRQELPKLLKEKGHQQPLASCQYIDYRKSELDIYGRAVIESQVHSKNNLALQDRWSRHKERFPFMTAFTDGFIYAGYYAAIKQNSPIDRNAQADYEHMTYLHHADILVSADARFQRDAFMELWEPRGKVLYTPEEFIQFIDQL